MKYRKKPVEIDAEQWFEPKQWPESYPCMDPRPEFAISVTFADKGKAFVKTMHQGQMVQIEAGDFIIAEPDGIHFYPCKPDIFHMRYELCV